MTEPPVNVEPSGRVQVKDIPDIEVIRAMRIYLQNLHPPYDNCVTAVDQLASRYPCKVAKRKVEKMLDDGTYFDVITSRSGTLTAAAWDLLRDAGDEPPGPADERYRDE